MSREKTRWLTEDREKQTGLPQIYQGDESRLMPLQSSTYSAGQQVEPITTHSLKPSWELEKDREQREKRTSVETGTWMIYSWETDASHSSEDQETNKQIRLSKKCNIKNPAQNTLETKWGLHGIHRRDVVQIFRKSQPVYNLWQNWRKTRQMRKDKTERF